jgi:hypothetical protein
MNDYGKARQRAGCTSWTLRCLPPPTHVRGASIALAGALGVSRCRQRRPMHWLDKSLGRTRAPVTLKANPQNGLKTHEVESNDDFT